MAVPPAPVVVWVGEMVPHDAPVSVNWMGSPGLPVPPPFLTVTVIVDVDVPSAGMEVGLAVAVGVKVPAATPLVVCVTEAVPEAPVASVAVIVQKPDVVDVV